MVSFAISLSLSTVVSRISFWKEWAGYGKQAASCGNLRCQAARRTEAEVLADPSSQPFFVLHGRFTWDGSLCVSTRNLCLGKMSI